MPSGITFFKLHKIIQAAFGWQDYHLFEFEFPDVIITIPMDDLDKPQKNAKSTRIDSFIDRNDDFLYIYDFGENHIEFYLISCYDLNNKKRNYVS